MSLLVQSIQIHFRRKGIALGSRAEVRRPLIVPVAQFWAGGTREGGNPACLIFSLLSTGELHTCVSSSFASRPRINATGMRRIMTFTPKVRIAVGTKMTKGMFVTCTLYHDSDWHLFFSIPSCAKLNKVTLRKGNATHDQVCLDQLPTYLTPSTLSMRFSNKTKNSDLRMFKENLVTSASGDLLSVTTTENPSSTPDKKSPDVAPPTSAKGEMTTGGNRDTAFTLSCTSYLEVPLVNTIFMWELPANPL